MSKENIDIKIKLKITNAQKLGLKRNPIDKYYTSPKGVINCMDLIKTHIKINKTDICIEPSAGDGAFINSMKSLGSACKFYDLEPAHNDVVKQDYLILDYNTIQNTYNKIHLIGNPPFGRQSSLVIKFIKHSAKFCDTISFILPKSFKKDSMKKHFPLNFWLICEKDLPKNSFLVNGKKHDVPCVFQIWEKRNTKRKLPEKLIPKNFTFVKKNIPHDISFRRVGVYAGKIDTHTEDKSPQSHYFIKFKNIEVNSKLIEQIKNIRYNSCDHTVGPKSISKQELIKEFNRVIITQFCL